MKRVLLVDDEVTFLKSLKDGLAGFSTLEVVTASNGMDAVEILSKTPIDLVVTDIQMPKMDGFELLAYLTKHHPDMPAIVISAFTTPTMREELSHVGATVCLDKPVDFDELSERIFDALLERQANRISGISVASLVQLLSMERKTCCLRVHRGGRVGYLMMRSGHLVQAQLDNMSGESAAFEIIGWGEAAVDLDRKVPPVENEITRGVNYIVLEALRRADELGKASPLHASIPPGSPAEEAAFGQAFEQTFGKQPALPRADMVAKLATTDDRPLASSVEPIEVVYHDFQLDDEEAAPMTQPYGRPVLMHRPSMMRNRQGHLLADLPDDDEPESQDTLTVRSWPRYAEHINQPASVSPDEALQANNWNYGGTTMNISKLQSGMENLKNSLGAGLLASDIFGPEGMPLVGFGSTPERAPAFIEITRMIRARLETAGMERMGRYYMIELYDGKIAVVISYRDYQWGALVDLTKVNLGIMLTIAIPQAIKDLQAALV